MKHIKHVKYILPADKYFNQLPNYARFGRKTTLRINPDQIRNLHWKLVDAYHTTNIGQIEIKDITVHDITFNISTCASNVNFNTKTYTTQSRCEPLICSILPIT